MDTLRLLYSVFMYDRNKERFDMILEPFQAMVQLALLSFCPLGSKLSITNNIVHIQEPTWTQGVLRKYNADKKDDLVYLFSVIKRFYQFYSFLRTKNRRSLVLFELIIEYSNLGLDKLIQTYSSSDNANISQTLKMYKALLLKPSAFQIQQDLEEVSTITGNTNHTNNTSIADSSTNQIITSSSSTTTTDTPQQQTQTRVIRNVDDIFQQITMIYDDAHYQSILNILLLLRKYPENYVNYIKTIECLMQNIHLVIRKWICENIVF
jgi:hypothetical protein